MKIAHISKYRRFGPQGVHTGGVAKFGWYLQRAIPAVAIFAWEDFPDWQEYELKAKDWEKAPLLNAWLLEEGHIDGDTIAVVDGFWGLGLEGKVERLVSVCHGSFAGAMVEHMKNSWDDGFLLGQSVRHQEAFWRDSGCEIVAVSRNAARELKLLSGLDATVIENGIDLEIFRPRSMLRSGILEATGGIPAKGAAIVEELKSMGYLSQPFGITSGDLEEEAERWSEANVALFPSHYEGNSYALLEAMACDCGVVGYWTGFVPDILHPHSAGFFTDDHSAEAFAHAIDTARICAHEPRKFVPSYDDFAKEWRAYLKC